MEEDGVDPVGKCLYGVDSDIADPVDNKDRV